MLIYTEGQLEVLKHNPLEKQLTFSVYIKWKEGLMNLKDRGHVDAK